MVWDLIVNPQREGGRGHHGCFDSFLCRCCTAKCDLIYTETFWQHKLVSLTVYIKRSTMWGLTFVLGSIIKEETLWCFSLWFYSTLILLRGKWAGCVWRLFTAQGLVTVCWYLCETVYFGCFFNPFKWKCTHLALLNGWRQNKWNSKKRGLPAWSVVVFLSLF